MNPAERIPHTRRFPEKRSEGPRRVRNGIKLKSLFDFETSAELTAASASPAVKVEEATGRVASLHARWIKLVESVIESDRMSAGLVYARSGQIVTLEILPGSIDAQVQGTAPRPYSVQVQLA